MMLLWIDLETTGLDPRRDAVLEVAVRTSTLDRPFNSEFVMHEAIGWAGNVGHLHPAVQEMHTRTGLFSRCRKSIVRMRDIDEALCGVVPVVADRDERPVLAGSTVHFDRAFLERDCPMVCARLSHRHYDVSAIKLFCQSLGMPKLPKGEAHSAVDDVFESIAHALSCRRWLSTYGGA